MCDSHLNAYDFTLPQHLIATKPIYPKENAKLLVYQQGQITHTTFAHLFEFIPQDYLIVLNDTKVLKARFFAHKILQGYNQYTQDTTRFPHTNIPISTKKEFFYHKALTHNRHLVQIRGKAKLHDCFLLFSSQSLVFISIVALCDNGFKEVVFFTLTQNTQPHFSILESMPHTYLSDDEVLAILDSCGEIPLPPYIKRTANYNDIQDYQSIFATHEGSVAAPTASLHFSESMLEFMRLKYEYAFITLHVGAGTFKPVVAENILQHQIHTELCSIPESSAKKILQTDKILCIGTTAMRSVEWFIHTQKTHGENNMFLHPFNRPKKVKALLTNFHLPKSSLLMLVSSMIGRKETLHLYNQAIAKEYRFYSYGDGMLIIE